MKNRKRILIISFAIAIFITLAMMYVAWTTGSVPPQMKMFISTSRLGESSVPPPPPPAYVLNDKGRVAKAVNEGEHAEVTVDDLNTALLKKVPEPEDEVPVPEDPKASPDDVGKTKELYDQPFLSPLTDPLSTFGIDVDKASYAYSRKMISRDRLPTPYSVRIEEFINYFRYTYPEPVGELPLAINWETAQCPWDTKNILVRIGMQGKHINLEKAAPCNLVFLIDVSGSMSEEDKLPLLKRSFRLLTDNLRKQDRVSIVVYAGAAGLVLPATRGDKKAQINAAVDKLNAGGSTAGGEGIILAYQTAEANFIKDGNNRVIIATDGDFNVGISSDYGLEELIEQKREKGVFLTVLGFGTGNYQDGKMEKLADKGNGNYAYIDNLLEANKVLSNEFGGTMFTIAKDVKLQVEFNPMKVRHYRLIGYENRRMADEDFDDDTKDSGDLGSGHSVTALYEITPGKAVRPKDLKYQHRSVNEKSKKSSELMTVKLRYKAPDADKSTAYEAAIPYKTKKFADASQDFRFAVAAAGFGLLLQNHKYGGAFNFTRVQEIGKAAKGTDENGYRTEFLKLVEAADLIMKTDAGASIKR